ncbi:MAG: hypothetical protein KGN84_19850 [Acidobacteriota bacterium]|nr:hypothetical protein [Acidobacteriota bacterium]
MTRTIMAALACAASLPAQTPTTAGGTYTFATLHTLRNFQEAVTIVRTVADVPQVSADADHSAMTLRGPVDLVKFAAWILTQIDRAAGDTGVHEYALPSGEVGRVRFLVNATSTQQTQEMLTILRTVGDVRRIFNLSSNSALVFRGPKWQVDFADWMIDELDQPAKKQPEPPPVSFTVGGPDVPGVGHDARLNFVKNLTSPVQTQEMITVLRTVGDVMKVFTYSSSHALVFRADDAGVERAEWLIQQLDLPPGQGTGMKTYTASAGDDVTRVFYLTNPAPGGQRTAVAGLHSDLGLKKLFFTTSPAAVVVRGTTDEVGAATQWMASHNALGE